MGPDEFHEKYPGATEGGLRNNAYTNVMVAWLCELAQEVLSLLPGSRAAALRDRLGLGDEELRTWEDMSRRMFVPFQDGGIISQFEGWDQLEELDWDAYRAKYGNIQRLDRILRSEGDDPDRYKVAKQADTVMLFYLFSSRGAAAAVRSPRLRVRARHRSENVAYYDRRTSHGSTLSYVAYAGVLAALDAESSWDRFLVALNSDVGDVQGGTTKEGIHVGVMAGTLDLIQRSYMGTRVRDGVLWFDPRLPAPIDRRVVLDAVPADPATGDARRRPADARRPSRGRQPADQGRSRRSKFASSAPATVTPSSCSQTESSSSNSTAREEHACRTDSRERSLTSTACSSTRPTRRRGASRCVS